MENPTSQQSLGPHANAMTHGFDATDQLFLSHLYPFEREVFDSLRAALYESYDPQTLVEQLIVDRIAIHYCRLFRFYRLEYHTVQFNMSVDGSGAAILPHLDRFSRYDARLSSHLNTLERALQSARRARELSHQLSQDEKLSS